MQPGREVHWHEGLFLQPHHLQLLQRDLSDRIVSDRRLSRAYPYGVAELEVSDDELKNMRVRIRKLRAVMPSGVRVDVPGNAELPALDIREAFQASSESLTIYLGVPLWYPDRANTFDGSSVEGEWWRVKCLYQVKEDEILDENTGSNAKPVLMRSVNARLVLPEGDRSDMEVLPLLRIRRSTGDEGGKPEIDTEFLPPCLVVKGSKGLYHRLKDLVNQIEASRLELVNQLTRGGFQIDTIRGVQIEQMLRLKTLNRFAARLPSLLEAPSVTPFEFYLEMGELMGELAALQPDTDPFEMPAYRHDDPAEMFRVLDQRVRPMLHGISATRFFKEAFVFDEDSRAWTTKLSDDDLALANEFFLGIKTREDPIEVSKLVEDPDRFKLMPRSIVLRRVRGLALKEERHPPMELPAEVGLHYFRVHRDENPQIWEQIEKEKEMGCTWVGVQNSDFALTLYMTVPEVSS